MSAYLGKIHYWLYDKIKFQEKILEEVVEVAKTKGFNVKDLVIDCIKKFGNPITEDLESEINQDNIHGWLQDKIASVESRLAYIITELLKSDKLTKDEINLVFEDNARNLAKGLELKNTTPSEMYSLIYDYLLAGMPCDRVNIIEKTENDELRWSTAVDIHIKYWENVNGDVSNFHNFIENWIAIFVKESNTGLSYKKIQGISIIERV